MKYKKETPFDKLTPEELDLLHAALNHYAQEVDSDYYDGVISLLKRVEDSIKFKEFAQHGG